MYSVISEIDIGYIIRQLDSKKKTELFETNGQSKERLGKRLER